MKIGKKVWWMKKGAYVSGELVAFDRGEMAVVKLDDGTEKEVRKINLLPKKPK